MKRSDTHISVLFNTEKCSGLMCCSKKHKIEAPTQPHNEYATLPLKCTLPFVLLIYLSFSTNLSFLTDLFPHSKVPGEILHQTHPNHVQLDDCDGVSKRQLWVLKYQLSCENSHLQNSMTKLLTG